MSFTELYDTLKENKICLPVDVNEIKLTKYCDAVSIAYFELINQGMEPVSVYFSIRIVETFTRLGFITAMGMKIESSEDVPDDEFVISCKKAK